MADVTDILSLPYKLGQQTIDYVAQQLYTIYETYFPTDEDNSEKPLLIPSMMDATVFWNDNGLNYGSRNVRLTIAGDLHYTESTEPQFYLSNIRAEKSLSAITYQGQPESDIAAAVDAFNSFASNTIPLDIQKTSNFAPPVYYANDSGQIYTFYRYYKNASGYDTRTSSFLSVKQTKGNGSTLTASKFGFRYYPDKSIDTARPSDPINSRWPECYVDIFKDTSLVTTQQNNQMITNITNNNYNSQSYTSIGGDTFNYYYNDNQIIIPVGVGTNGTSNTLVGGGVALAYNDFKLIFDDILDHINIAMDNQGDDVLTFPSYNEIKYGDRGDFYIPPIEQIPTLPSAPVLTYDLELADTPQLVGGAITSYLDIMDALGVSSLLVGCIIVVFIINKLRGH